MSKQYSEEIIEAFILSKSKNEIAQKTGLSLRTIYRYKHNPEFIKLLEERKSEYIKAACNKMQSMLLKGAYKLEEIIEDPETPKSTQVTAIQTLFNQCREWTTIEDIMKRLEAIEAAQNGPQWPK